jgi:spore coat protein U-like protein
VTSGKRALTVAAVALGGSAASAWGGSANTSFNVTATVINNCTVTSNGISFGSYDPTRASASTAQGGVVAKCTRGDSVTVALDQGTNPAPGSTPTVPARRMTDGAAHYLPYHIYFAPSPSKVEWGAGAAGKNQPSTQIAASVGAPLTFTTYGSLPAGTNTPAGSYLDIITATVTF